MRDTFVDCGGTWARFAAGLLVSAASVASAQGTSTVRTHVDCQDGLKAQAELRHCKDVSWLKATVPLAGPSVMTADQPRTCEENGNCDAALVVLINQPSGSKTCQSVLQYNELTVKGFKKGKQLTWTIRDADVKAGYRFKEDADGSGMRFLTPKGESTVPGDWWKVGPTSQNSVVSEVIKTPGAGVSARLCHYPRVTDSKGNLCCPIDPIIINDPS
ncbi:MAG: hypothetical protein JNM33_04165 [Rubrivivax sp.]|nr:hypothetical protein [Rubrivivax sp.]